MVNLGGFFPKLEFSRGFLYVYLIYIAGRISAAAMAGYIIFFSLADPVVDYTWAHTAIIRGVFVYKSQWYRGKIYALGSPRSGLKRTILFQEVSRGFLCKPLISSRRNSEAAMGGAGAIYFLGCR